MNDPQWRSDYLLACFPTLTASPKVKLELDWLKANHTKLHYFGLGFIQLKLSADDRLHFYTSKLPAIVSEEEIHNHRYNFSSEIVRGVLVQEIFEISEGDSYTIEEESCQEGVEASKSSQRCGILMTSKHLYTQGSQYFVHHNTFHRVKSSGCCITYLTRGSYQKPMAKVIRPVGADKVCPFGKKVDEKDLWEIIEEMIRGDWREKFIDTLR